MFFCLFSFRDSDRGIVIAHSSDPDPTKGAVLVFLNPEIIDFVRLGYGEGNEGVRDNGFFTGLWR